MKHTDSILTSILSTGVYTYILFDTSFHIVQHSEHIEKYLSHTIVPQGDIFEYFPELVGSEDYILKLLGNTGIYHLKAIQKNNHYLNIRIEAYDDENFLLLVHDVTEMMDSKQELLQHSNDSLLLNNILQKILDQQNVYTFVVYHEEIVFANKRFLGYFHSSTVEEMNMHSLNLYQRLDTSLTSYSALYEKVKDKEEYMMIGNDTFILQASLVESTHQLFTLTKITNISKKLQYDTLTKAYKKEYFNQQLEKVILLEENAAVIVLDLDDFKSVNDRYGHQIGDDVLVEFTQLIQKNIKEEDIFARWGGEEFLLLLKDATQEHAMEKAKQIRKVITLHHFKNISSLTSSIGVALLEDNDTLHSVLLRADKALYEAKCSGKNCVVLKLLKKVKK